MKKYIWIFTYDMFKEHILEIVSLDKELKEMMNVHNKKEDIYEEYIYNILPEVHDENFIWKSYKIKIDNNKDKYIKLLENNDIITKDKNWYYSLNVFINIYQKLNESNNNIDVLLKYSFLDKTINISLFEKINWKHKLITDNIVLF